MEGNSAEYLGCTITISEFNGLILKVDNLDMFWIFSRFLSSYRYHYLYRCKTQKQCSIKQSKLNARRSSSLRNG